MCLGVEKIIFIRLFKNIMSTDETFRKLHTRRLLPTHVPVGYWQQNDGFYIAIKQSKQIFKRLHVALIDIVHFEKIL